MHMTRHVALAFFLTLASASPVWAQTEQGSAGGGRTQELVDQLKEVIRETERDRRSSPTTIRLLKDLVRRYDWPWKVSLLDDDFRDGDYTQNPRWVVKHGDFYVLRSGGVRSYFEPSTSGTYRASDRRSDSPALEILSEILLGGRERPAGEPQASANAAAEITTRVKISNAFLVKLELNLRRFGEQNTRLEFGPFQGEERTSGYRLAYEAGHTPSVSLIRFGPNSSAVIERIDQGIALDDGMPHILEWRRQNDGEMVVLLDDKEVMRTMDRAYGEPFDGFAVFNKGGEFDLKRVSILGTQP